MSETATLDALPCPTGSWHPIPDPPGNWFELDLEPEFMRTRAGTPRRRVVTSRIMRELPDLPRLRETYHRLRRYFLPPRIRSRRYSIRTEDRRDWVTITEGKAEEYPVRPREGPGHLEWRRRFPSSVSHPKHWLKLLLGHISLSVWWRGCPTARCLTLDLDFSPRWCDMTPEQRRIALAPWLAACEQVDVELGIHLRPQFYASGGKGVWMFIPLDRHHRRSDLALLLHEIVSWARARGAKDARDDDLWTDGPDDAPVVTVCMANVPSVDLGHRSMREDSEGTRVVWSRYWPGMGSCPERIRSGWIDHEGRHVEDQIGFFLAMEDSSGVEVGLSTLRRHWDGLGVLHDRVRRVWWEGGWEGTYEAFVVGLTIGEVERRGACPTMS